MGVKFRAPCWHVGALLPVNDDLGPQAQEGHWEGDLGGAVKSKALPRGPSLFESTRHSQGRTWRGREPRSIGHPLCARPSHGACPAPRRSARPDFTRGLPTRSFTLAHCPGANQAHKAVPCSRS